MARTPRTRTVALVSGGLDSLLLVRALLARSRSVWPVYVRCGLAWERAELWWLRRWLAAIRQVDLRTLAVLDVPLRSVYGRHWSVTARGVPSSSSTDDAVYLPGRNVLLVGHAAVWGNQRGMRSVALGTLAGNPFGDATPRFFEQFGRCLSAALSAPMRIEAPLRRSSKSRLIARDPRAPFVLTFSCIRPSGRRHCGRCNKCAERRRAFIEAGVADPTAYAN